MKRLADKIRNNMKLKRIILTILCIVVSLYSFSLPAFSGRSFYNYISYFLMAALGFITIFYYLFYLKFTFYKLIILIPLFVVWAVIGTLIYSHQFRNWVGLFLMSLTFVILFYAFEAINDFKKILKFIVFGMYAFCLYFFIVYFKDILNFDEIAYFRLGSYFDNVNAIGSYCSFSILLILFISLFGGEKKDYLNLIGTLPFVFIGITTGSREFILDFVLYVLLMLFFKLKKKPWLYAIIVSSFAVSIAGVLSLPFMATITKRLLSAITNILGTSNNLDTSLYQRILWQEYGFYLGSGNLLTGYGIGGFAKYSGVGTYTHGNYAELVADFGVIGLCLFYLMPIVSFAKALHSKNLERYFVSTVFIVVCIINGITDLYFSKKTTYILFALICFCSVHFVPKNQLSPNCKMYLIEI